MLNDLFWAVRNTVKWDDIEQFSMFFLNNIDYLIIWLQYYKLKPLQPLFSGRENNCFIVHEFLSNKDSHSSSKSPHQNRATLNKEILWLEKLIQIFPARTVTICDMHKSKRCFCTLLDTLGEINFRPKLLLKTSNFSHENCRLG